MQTPFNISHIVYIIYTYIALASIALIRIQKHEMLVNAGELKKSHWLNLNGIMCIYIITDNLLYLHIPI